MPERSDRRKEREFGEFQWRLRGLSRFFHRGPLRVIPRGLDLFVHFGSSQNGHPDWRIEQISTSQQPTWTKGEGKWHRPGINFTPLGEKGMRRRAPQQSPSERRQPDRQTGRRSLAAMAARGQALCEQIQSHVESRETQPHRSALVELVCFVVCSPPCSCVPAAHVSAP